MCVVCGVCVYVFMARTAHSAQRRRRTALRAPPSVPLSARPSPSPFLAAVAFAPVDTANGIYYSLALPAKGAGAHSLRLSAFSLANATETLTPLEVTVGMGALDPTSGRIIGGARCSAQSVLHSVRRVLSFYSKV